MKWLFIFREIYCIIEKIDKFKTMYYKAVYKHSASPLFYNVCSYVLTWIHMHLNSRGVYMTEC